jgi:hypothetical protein
MHSHTFDQSEWPFDEPTNVAAFGTVRVFREDYPILYVSHDHDGDWQILCGTTNDLEHAMVVCLGCAFQKDPTIGQLADLPIGWIARRESVNHPWVREHTEPQPDGS